MPKATRRTDTPPIQQADVRVAMLAVQRMCNDVSGGIVLAFKHGPTAADLDAWSKTLAEAVSQLRNMKGRDR